MRVSVERLRKGLLAGAGLLILVIVGLLAYAHYRAHRFLTELPRKLGADIRQETNSFTWSQTVKGRTIFTVHAAKAIQHQDGKYTMHDVAIAVYGNGQGESNRVDRIYGKEFQLDQAAGIVKAMGEVHLDLQVPTGTPGATEETQATGSTQTHDKDLKNSQLIHVKTSGLVYQQKLGLAATEQQIEFEYNGLTGHATGADYNADSGILVLHSGVMVSGLDHGRPLLLTASQARLNRMNHSVLLSEAKFVTVNGEGDGEGARQTVEARDATVLLRPDGSAERMIGEGGVRVTGGDGSQVVARHGEMLLSAANKPQSMTMKGDVHYTASDPSRQADGEAAEAVAAFDGQGHVEKAVLTGAVHLKEQIAPANGAKGAGSQRDLTAATVEMALASDAKGRSWIRDAKANGNARLEVRDQEKDGKGMRTSSMQGDVLTAQFLHEDGRSWLNGVHGSGATVLEQKSGNGIVQTSSGDRLDVAIRRPSSGSPSGSSSSDIPGEIDTAVQQGHVIATRTAPAKPGGSGGMERDRATAEKLTYDGRTQRMMLSGSVEMQTPDGMLWADHVAVEQKTGDAAADGLVKASYRGGTHGDALHVLAGRADLKKASNTAIFYGLGGQPARLWQGGSQIEAPVLEFDRGKDQLTARGDGDGSPMAVRTVLLSAGSTKQAVPAASSKTGLLRKAAVVRIASREMIYSDEAHTAQFTGGVKVESADGVMRGQRATAYLQSGPARKDAVSAPGSGFMGGGVERVAVEGEIEIEQSGRRATGNRLIYTADDGVFVLTGTEAEPPKVMDATRGTVTGRELRFREQDASVVISNGDANGTGQRVRTETRVKRER